LNRWSDELSTKLSTETLENFKWPTNQGLTATTESGAEALSRLSFLNTNTNGLLAKRYGGRARAQRRGGATDLQK
jgi:hypothetical protein